MTRLTDILTGTRREIVTEGQLGLLFRKGQLTDVLTAGEHRLNREGDVLERVDLNTPLVQPAHIRLLRKILPALAETHLTEIRAGEAEMVVVLREDRPVMTIAPLGTRVLWTEAGPWGEERHGLTSGVLLPDGLGDRLAARRSVTATALGLTQLDVPDGHRGFLMDGRTQVAELAPGRHWARPRDGRLTLRNVDLRRRVHDVTGQEVLTKDRVTLRVNLTAEYRVTDAATAVAAAHDWEAVLHRALQLALRRVVGTRTLDQLLADKVVFDAETAVGVRTDMAALGVEVGEIALRDVILPGEMRDILTAVVAAEKEAEAATVHRRQEAEVTRALLNQAKVMADNPVMLRLKELEALERVADRVGTLTVHNGTSGLLGDLVKLRD
ncbi:MAG: slipin family protein [Pseudomonadota bacterium]